jgi:hypothetical protein
VLAVSLVCSWPPWTGTGQAQEAGIQIALTSTPPLEHIRPNTDLAHLTLTAFLHGQPLSQGQMQVQLMAPARTQFVATGFPRVEGTTLLALDTALTDGTWTVQYLFPMRGTYTFDVGITPAPGGPVFQPTRLRQTVHIAEDPAVVRNASMLIGALFLLGGIAGIIFARSAAAREKLWGSASVVLLLGLSGALVPVHGALADSGHRGTTMEASQGHQVIHGDQGWELEVQASPTPATVGQLVRLAVWLRKEGTMFPGTTDVRLEVVHREEAHTVLGTHMQTPQGHTLQSLQLYDGAPHTINVTVRPVTGEDSDVAPLTATLGLEVVALHPPLAVKIRMMAILLGVFVVGMAGGFFLPWPFKEPAGA